MSKVIWKYELKTQDLIEVKMPIGSEILTLQTQNEKPCLWVLVDPNLDLVKRKFQIVGTGHTISKYIEQKYIGTYQSRGGFLVFHLFEYF